MPERWRSGDGGGPITVGTRVRVELQGRRVGGWVTALDPEPIADVKLSPLKNWSGFGPSADVIALAEWVAWRWLGTPAKALRTASSERNIRRLGQPAIHRWDGHVEPWAKALFVNAGSVARVPPGADRWPIVLAAASFGNPLLLVPTIETARRLEGRLQRAGLRTALLPDDWGRAAAGSIVVGTRAAALGPAHEPGAIVVFDEHDEAFREERTPTWHARDVAVERARRAGIPCVLTSAAPSLEALGAFALQTVDRSAEFDGWPAVDVIDRRDEPPGRLGLFSEPLVRLLRNEGRVACILNRVGRVRLLGCSACGELVSCETCSGAMSQIDDSLLQCGRCEQARPPVCAACGGARLKNLVLGVGRAREELEALLGEPVGEVTASTAVQPDARIVLGTEALLRASVGGDKRWRSIAFLDFDQHLAALRQRAEADALALILLAARHVGKRRSGGRLLVQTRQPDHRVLDAARRADPSRLAVALGDQAAAMRWPPSVAQATISGKGAATFIEALGSPLGLDIRGPHDDAWQVRAADVETLVMELRAIDRPAQRLRIAID